MTRAGDVRSRCRRVALRIRPGAWAWVSRSVSDLQHPNQVFATPTLPIWQGICSLNTPTSPALLADLGQRSARSSCVPKLLNLTMV